MGWRSTTSLYLPTMLNLIRLRTESITLSNKSNTVDVGQQCTHARLIQAHKYDLQTTSANPSCLRYLAVCHIMRISKSLMSIHGSLTCKTIEITRDRDRYNNVVSTSTCLLPLVIFKSDNVYNY